MCLGEGVGGGGEGVWRNGGYECEGVWGGVRGRGVEKGWI